MMKIGRTKALFLLSVVAFAAVLGGWYVTAYASATNGDSAMLGPCEPQLGSRGGGRMFGRLARNRFVEVSAEYEAKIIEIAEGDVDVQNLLADGYTVVGVRPIIRSVVDADGDVVVRARNAVVVLRSEDGMGGAAVWVDVDLGSVTKIVILSRTVIDKS